VSESLLIALDWDGTAGSDWELWSGFVKLAQDRGHRVFICTSRSEEQCDEIKKQVAALGLRVVATAGEPKIKAADDIAGYLPDIWIDDQPHWLFRDVVE
jgi:predicted mannosyl-3-phosphoglycerate phosphatase (HAD superfamily)